MKLRLLGNATLQGEQGSLSGRAVQPRRLALLALLALSPRKSLSRDKLLAYLWPDSDTEQGRHLLSVAVYELRKAIGDATLVTSRDELALGVDALEIDVDEFEAALHRGASERAVELYPGPLLDAFHIADAPEFEHWLDAQRAHLARRYAEALEQVAHARSAAGDRQGAVAAWRRLSDHDRYSARVVCGLMQALEASGDRAGALQHALAHAALMREEFDAGADPEVTALADRLRTAPREAIIAVGRIGAGAPQPASSPRFVSRTRSALVGLTLTIAFVAGLALWRARGSAAPAASSTDNITIAVLPFENLSPTDTAGVFSDGVTEEIISALSRVPSLSVVSRSSSFVFRGNVDARVVARSLMVGHILEGTVRTDGARVRVVARLIDAKDGYEVWSDVYDNPLEMRNVMAIQEKIAQSVVTELARRFDRLLDHEPLLSSATDDVQAFELFVAGKRLFHRRTVPDLQRALQFYEQAIGRDADYALAHAGRAEVYTLLGAYDYAALPPATAFATARMSAERALELDANLADAHSALGSVRFNYDWDWAGAEQEYRRAIQLSPGYATARHWYSLLLLSQGRDREALEQITRARELDPLSSVTSAGLARCYYFMRDFDRAIAVYESTLAGDSAFVTAHVGLGLSRAATGDFDGAIRSYEAAARMLGMTPPLIRALIANAHGRAGREEQAVVAFEALQAAASQGYVPAEYLAVAHTGMGNLDAAFAAFVQAVANRSAGVVYLDVEPLVDPLRADPRFDALLVEVGISGR
jgi:TolB-like protein/DNA-binding SARP family transcriptional activator/tetratricopeptide (TPR) repeat protein